MEDVIRKYFQCWLDKDINDVKEIFSDDIIYSECYGPVYKGIGQIIRWFDEKNLLYPGNTEQRRTWK